MASPCAGDSHGVSATTQCTHSARLGASARRRYRRGWTRGRECEPGCCASIPVGEPRRGGPRIAGYVSRRGLWNGVYLGGAERSMRLATALYEISTISATSARRKLARGARHVRGLGNCAGRGTAGAAEAADGMDRRWRRGGGGGAVRLRDRGAGGSGGAAAHHRAVDGSWRANDRAAGLRGRHAPRLDSRGRDRAVHGPADLCGGAELRDGRDGAVHQPAGGDLGEGCAGALSSDE